MLAQQVGKALLSLRQLGPACRQLRLRLAPSLAELLQARLGPLQLHLLLAQQPAQLGQGFAELALQRLQRRGVLRQRLLPFGLQGLAADGLLPQPTLQLGAARLQQLQLGLQLSDGRWARGGGGPWAGGEGGPWAGGGGGRRARPRAIAGASGGTSGGASPWACRGGDGATETGQPLLQLGTPLPQALGLLQRGNPQRGQGLGQGGLLALALLIQIPEGLAAAGADAHRHAIAHPQLEQGAEQTRLARRQRFAVEAHRLIGPQQGDLSGQGFLAGARIAPLLLQLAQPLHPGPIQGRQRRQLPLQVLARGQELALVLQSR